MGDSNFLSEDGKFFKKLIYTRTFCSCYAYGNPRRYSGEKTRQEKLSDLEFQEQILLTDE